MAARPQPVLVSVSLAQFDTAIGNTIDFVYPPLPDAENRNAIEPADYLGEGLTLTGLKGLQDFCFPDGAHDTFYDVTPVVVRVSSTTTGTQPANNATGAQTTDAQDSNTSLLFGVAVYHLKKDSTVHRGARQRGILIVTRRPVFDSLAAVARRIILPLLATPLALAPGAVLASPTSPSSSVTSPAAGSTAASPTKQASDGTSLDRDEEAVALREFVRRLFHLLQPIVDAANSDDAATLLDDGSDPLARPWCCVTKAVAVDDPAATFAPDLSVFPSRLDTNQLQAALRQAAMPRVLRVHLPTPQSTLYDAMCHGVRVAPLLRQEGGDYPLCAADASPAGLRWQHGRSR
jgi:hypothetical protein